MVINLRTFDNQHRMEEHTMKRVIPIIGIAAVITQLIRLWPLDVTTVLSAFVTGGVFYIACKLGWDMQKDRILQDGYKGWGVWVAKAVRGTVIFLTLSLALLFFSFHNPICKETGDQFYGRCEKYAGQPSDTEKDIPFNPANKSFYPLLLALVYYTGSAAKRIEYTKDKN